MFYCESVEMKIWFVETSGLLFSFIPEHAAIHRMISTVFGTMSSVTCQMQLKLHNWLNFAIKNDFFQRWDMVGTMSSFSSPLKQLDPLEFFKKLLCQIEKLTLLDFR